MKLTKDFSVDLRKLADDIWLGKIEPLEAWYEFNVLIKKHYGDVDSMMADFLYSKFSMYLQIYTFNKLGHIGRLLLELATGSKKNRR